MPPKGWRKDQDTQYISSKERDQISIDDILFPKSTVNKLARAILPDNGLVSKDSSIAIQRSATVFVSYLLVHARTNAKKFDRKIVGPQDIIAALEAAEFSSFIPAVKEELDQYQARKDALKEKRKLEKEEKEKESGSKEEVTATTTTTKDGNDTVDENDSFATANDDDDDDTKKDESSEPQPKKLKNGSREATVSDSENQ